MVTEGVGAMIKTHVDQTVRIEKSLKSLVSFISFKTFVGFLLLHSFCYFCEVVRSEAASGKPVATTSAAEKVEWQGINLVEISASSVGKFGRKVGSKIWSDAEIMTHMVSPKKIRGSHCRPPFPESEKQIWERKFFENYRTPD